ncbi:hypothetical protein SUGI_0529760 [Cryptomeria japonica]|nr:hypothetical protein SUGI_0529760 [Cryptomeria japonica]
MDVIEAETLERAEEEKIAMAVDGGDSSEDEAEVIPKAVAWKLNLEEQKPVIYAMIKDKTWIQLQKPRKSYEELIRSFLVSAHFLHFARRNPEASEKAYWEHLRKSVSTSDEKPAESDLLKHFSMIESMYQRDEKLKNANILKIFLEMKSKKRKPSDEDGDNNSKAKRAKFLVSDEESDRDFGEDGLDESDEEEDDLFDSVCAICDNGGDLLCCEGPCMRSFHPNKEAGEDSNCKSLGLSKAQVKEIQNFYCRNCKYKQHQCFICGKLGSSDKSLRPEVFNCVSATCGLFYHPRCVSIMIAPEAEAEELEKKIGDGLQFTCPVHRCIVCKQTEQKGDEDMQFAICRRCPKAYHRKCLPKSIHFEDVGDEPQRAWDDLIPNRILIYCRKHKIDQELATPKRNHIIYPEVPSADKIVKRNHVISPESGVGKTVGKKKMKSPSSTSEKFALESIKERASPKPSVKKEKITSTGILPKVRGVPELPKKAMKEVDIYSTVKEDKHANLEMKKSLGLKQSKSNNYDLNKNKTAQGLTSSKQDQKKPAVVLPTFVENDIKITIMDIIKRSTSGISLDGVYKKHQVPSTHTNYNMRNLDKSITQGKVEGAVEAVRTALRKLEEGGNIDDAKAVCGADILHHMMKWRNKLKVYLAPFLHGMRYTSYGRHFTKIEKLNEVVERLHWYVQDGDTIVDFCCGANDFSRLMKAKLDQSGKKCFFKNFDIIQPKDDFEFEKRDWMTVQTDELATGSRLIMGLNPPFGVQACLANKFIDKALEFKPKLVILIVPKETKRLDKKREGYDLVWEDPDLLKGESFYMPGSVDVDDNQLGQWNTVPPPLYLWSRPDWTVVHKEISIKQGHVKNPTITMEPEVFETIPSQSIEWNLGLGKHAEKDQQCAAFGNETINKSGVVRDSEKESKFDSLSLVHQLDIPDKKDHEENIYSQRSSETQIKAKDADMNGKKEKSPVGEKERADPVGRERFNKGKHEKKKHDAEKSEKTRSESERFDRDRKRERPDRGKFEKERIVSSPPLKKMDSMRDDENEYNGYMREQGSGHINATNGFGRTFDGGPGSGNREYETRGLKVGGTELGQDIGRGFQGLLPGGVEEGYVRGYHRKSGGGSEGFGRLHTSASEDYVRGIQLSHSANRDEEYAPAEVTRGFSRSLPCLESDYSVPSDLQRMQNNGLYNRQAQYGYDSERSSLLQDPRTPDWLMGDSQRGRYHVEQASRISDAYVPELHNSLLLGKQHEEPSHLFRGTYQSETFGRSEISSSVMQRYAPRLDQNMNYARSSGNSSSGVGQARGSESFPFDPLAFAPGPKNLYPHQSSSGWIDD